VYFGIRDKALEKLVLFSRRQVDRQHGGEPVIR
jgi:hypothetical protein